MSGRPGIGRMILSIVVVVIVAVGGIFVYGFVLGLTPSTTNPSPSTSPTTSPPSVTTTPQTTPSSQVSTTPSPQSTSQGPPTTTGFPQFSITVDEVFGYRWSANAGYGLAVVVDLTPISNYNFDIYPGFIKLTTDLGSNFTHHYGNTTATSPPTGGVCQPGFPCDDIGLTGRVQYWLGFDFHGATHQPSLLKIQYDCTTVTFYLSEVTCYNYEAANATSSTFPGTRWVTFERDSASTGPVIVTSSLGTFNGVTTYNYFPNNATLHNVNVFISSSFTGIAPHEDLPGGYFVNISIPWQYNCGSLFNNIPCDQTPSFVLNIPDFKIISYSDVHNNTGPPGGGYVFYLTIEFPNVPYSSYVEGGGAIPITVNWS